MNLSKLIIVLVVSMVMGLAACSTENASIVENIESNQVSEDIMLQSSASVTESEDATMVYIAPYGKRYHYSQRCAGKNAMEVNLKDVIFKPCKKCAQ